MKKVKYVVECYTDYTGDHMGKPSLLIHIEKFGFKNLFEALNFLSECTDAVTKKEDLVPEYREEKVRECFE